MVSLVDEVQAVLTNGLVWGCVFEAENDQVLVIVAESTASEHQSFLARMRDEDFVLVENSNENPTEDVYDSTYIFRKAG